MRLARLDSPTDTEHTGLTETQRNKMARIAGVDIPNDKRGEIALTYVYGIGRSRATEILNRLDIDTDLRPQEWSDEQTRKVRRLIEDEYKVEGQLRTETQMNIKRLMDIGCYRGLRHRKGLPVRGQRTQTNARTRKGRKKTVPGKKKAAQKK
jgi:small subunit ribosomal protein S13